MACLCMQNSPVSAPEIGDIIYKCSDFANLLLCSSETKAH